MNPNLIICTTTLTVHYTSAEEFSEAKRIEYREYSAKLFGMVGGIAFLTLFVLAPTSGMLLKKLGLVTPTEAREKVIGEITDFLFASFNTSCSFPRLPLYS